MANLAKGLRQAYDAQDIAAQAVKNFQPRIKRMSDSKAIALAQLILALDKIQERIRIHRGRPLPGTLRPSAKKTKRRVVREHHEAAQEQSSAPAWRDEPPEVPPGPPSA